MKFHNLKQTMETHGFVSNEDYDYPIRCLMSAPTPHLRCLITQSEQPRRCTAFAYALAQALGMEHHRYYEFTEHPPTPQPVRVSRAEDGDEANGEEPVDELDRIVSEVCALSEGEETALILDCLHLAAFHQHLRINQFVRSHEWSFKDLTLKANARHLLVILIADQPLYHALQQASFTLWIDNGEEQATQITPDLLGLDDAAQPMLYTLKRLFDELNAYPTLGEYQRIVHDVHAHIHQLSDLRTSIYGWVEGIDRRHLMSETMHPHLQRAFDAIHLYLGLDDTAQLTDTAEHENAS